MKTPIIVIRRFEGSAESAHHLISRNHPGENVGAAYTRHLSGSQGCRQYRRTWVHGCRNMGVIEIQTVNQRAVDQRCSRKGISFIVSKHRPPSRIHTHAGNRSQQGRGRLGFFSCPNSDANTVRDQQGGPVDDLTRQGLCIYLARESTKGCGDTLILHESSLLNLKIPRALVRGVTLL